MANLTTETTIDQMSSALNLDHWSLLVYTAANMRPQQLSGVIKRKLRHAVVPRLPIDFDRRYDRRIPNSLRSNPEPIVGNSRTLRHSLSDVEREEYQDLTREASDGVITFLNRSIEFDRSGDIDWDHDKLNEYPLLWRLKLHSFEFLEWLALGFDRPSVAPNVNTVFQRWVLSWNKTNPIGEEKYLRRSWIPHSVSLRIMNLCRYCAWLESEGNEVPWELCRLIFKNALFLENHVEYDIGGNHLIENAAALTMAGVFFDRYNTGWTQLGLSVLEEAADEQFLDDGGHFERSPMYHIMVLRRYLTVVDLLERIGIEPPTRIRGVAESGLGFLRAIQAPDDRIPLLNDAVFGEELMLTSCLRYASRINVKADDLNRPDALDESGYYWLESENTRMLVDGGAVGPKHLPAHSHNDQLSFLFWIDGEPVITDTGTYEYAPTERRQYSRSVQAHNTVQVDNVEPIDIGGQYLMGRRSTPRARLIRGQQETTFKGRSKKRSLFTTVYTHKRRIKTRDGIWIVQDDIDADIPFRSRLHFHPNVSVIKSDREYYMVELEHTDTRLVIVPQVAGNTILKTSEYYPTFGVSTEREMLAFEDDKGRCEFTLRVQSEGESTPYKDPISQRRN